MTLLPFAKGQLGIVKSLLKIALFVAKIRSLKKTRPKRELTIFFSKSNQSIPSALDLHFRARIMDAVNRITVAGSDKSHMNFPNSSGMVKGVCP